MNCKDCHSPCSMNGMDIEGHCSLMDGEKPLPPRKTNTGDNRMNDMNRKDEIIGKANNECQTKVWRTIDHNLRRAYNSGYAEAEAHWKSVKDDFENQVKKAWKEGFDAGEEKAVIEKEMEYNRGLSDGKQMKSEEWDKLFTVRDEAYKAGYEAGKKDSNMDDHCSVCEFMSKNEWDAPCRDCMFSYASKFKPKSEEKPMTNRQKFEEVFGISDPPNAAVKSITLNSDGIKAEYDSWWDESYKEASDA